MIEKNVRFRLVVYILIYALFVPLLSADIFRGQVRDDISDDPIEGATIELRLDPVSINADITVLTDPFGFFESDEAVSSTNYTVTAKHPGYIDETVQITQDVARKTQNFRLMRRADLPGGPNAPIFDLYIQLADATSYLELNGFPVIARQYLASVGGGSVRTAAVAIDINGSAIVRGLTTGFYEFEINGPTQPNYVPGWESVPEGAVQPQRYFLNQTNTLNILLKAKEQTLKFKIQGYDFVKDSPDPFGPNPIPEPLEGVIVELTGVDPSDLDRKLLAPVNNHTDANGEVTFIKLPGITYQVEVKSLGYFTKTVTIDPDFQGMLPMDTQIIDLQAEPQGLIVYYEFPDYRPINCSIGFKGRTVVDGDRFSGQSMANMEVIVQGIEGTTTEGVVRRAFNEFQITECKTAGLFLSGYIKPGRYKLTIRGVAADEIQWIDSKDNGYTNNVSFSVFHEDYIEFHPVGPDPKSIISKQEHTVQLQTESSIITGQLLAAETTEITSELPIYEPLPNQQIIFHQPFNLDLFGDYTPITVTADSEGFYEVSLFPGIYAVELPGLTDHFGERYIYEVRSSNGGREIGTLIEGKWPYFEEWPSDKSQAGEVTERFNGNGIAINGGDSATLNLLLRKELYTVKLGVDTSGPTDLQVVYLDHDSIPPLSHVLENFQLVNAGGMAKIVGTTTGDHTVPFKIERRNVGEQAGKFPQVFARWENLTPDTYSFDLSDNNYDFQDSNLTPSVLIDYPIPGKVPSLVIAQTLENTNFDDDPSIPLTPEIRRPIDAFENDTPISVNAFRWDEDDSQYDVDVVDIFGVFQAPGYASGFFATVADPPAAPAGGSQVYVTDRFNSNDFYLVDNGGSVFIGGPIADSKTTRPEPAFNLEIQVFSIQDDHVIVPNVKLILGEGFDSPLNITTTSTPLVLNNLTRSPKITDDPTDNFILESVPPPFEISGGGGTPTVKRRVFVSRAIDMKVTVKDAESSQVLESVTVEAKTVYGNRINDISPLPRQLTDVMGNVTITGQRLQDYFIVIDQPGYEICRERLDTTNLQEVSGILTHNVTVNLIRINGPDFKHTVTPFNRFGAFLPGVTRSGGASAFELFSAKDALTASWTAEIHNIRDIDYLTPGFDNRDGTLSTQDTITFTDTIKTVYLVDRREFEKTGFQGNETELGVPATTHPLEMQQFLQNIIRGKSDANDVAETKTFLSRADTITHASSSNTTTVSGKINLWELPSGDFKPALIAQTRSGAYATFLIDYKGPDGSMIDESSKRLTGIKIPPWLGFAFDILGVSAGVSATQESIKKYVPEGKFFPFPEFTATIKEAEDDAKKKTGFIDYDYSLKVGTEIGQDSPGGGIASLGPGLLGAEISATAQITSVGKDRALNMSIESKIAKKDIDATEYVPKIASSFGIEPSISNISGNIKATVVANADGNKPFELRLKSEVGGDVDVQVKMNLTTVTGKIPYVGPVLTLLDKTGTLQSFATTAAGIGITDKYCWQTLRPLPVTTGDDPDKRAQRRHFLGGDEIDTTIGECKPTRDICLRFAVGLEAEAKALGFALGGKAKLELAGNNCGSSQQPSLVFTFNQFTDYPPIKRIQGEVNLVMKAFWKTPVKEFTKEYKWNLIKIDAQYGTETVVQLIPMELQIREQGFPQAGSNVFTSTGPDLLVKTTPLANVSSPEDTSDILLLPLFNNSTEEVELRLAPRDGDLNWGDTELIFSADFIGQNAIYKMPNGRILIAWAEPNPASDPTDILGSSFVKFVISDTNGENFTAPAFASFPGGAIVNLFIRQSRNNIGLFFRMVQGSLSTPAHQLFGLILNEQSNTFSSPAFLGQDTAGMRNLEVLGGGASAGGDFVIAFINEDNNLVTIRWDGTTVIGVSTLESEIQGGLAGYASADDSFDLFAAASDGRLLRYHSDSGVNSTFGAAIEIVQNVAATEAQLIQQDVSGDGGFLYVFMETTVDGSKLRYLYLNHLFEISTPGLQELTKNDIGRYSKLRVAKRSSDSAYIYAMFESDPPAVRVFELSVANGTSGNDSDGDGIDDIGELLIVDADPEDSISTVSDVIGTGNFDSDAFNNADEINLGSNPADPLSIPIFASISVDDNQSTEDTTQTVTFTVLLNTSAADTVNIDYTIGGAALIGSDYINNETGDVTIDSGGTIVFESGELSKTLVLNVVNDDDEESPESVTVTLMNPTNATLQAAEVTHTINDDDTEGQIIELKAGWNQIAINVTPSSRSPASIFSGITDLNLILGPNGQFGPTANSSSDTLTSLDAGAGYFVNLENPATLIIPGSAEAETTQISLGNGWNNVGYLLQTPVNIEISLCELISNNSNLIKVVGEGKSFDPALPANLNSLKQFTPGFGYWIKIKEDQIFTFQSVSCP